MKDLFISPSKIHQLAFVLLAILMVAGCKPDSSAIPDRPGKPNVVIILSDDQGWGDFSGLGNE